MTVMSNDANEMKSILDRVPVRELEAVTIEEPSEELS